MTVPKLGLVLTLCEIDHWYHLHSAIHVNISYIVAVPAAKT